MPRPEVVTVNTELKPSGARGGHGGRGFTLIEMLVVMTLIALLLTLAVPRYFRSLDSAKLNVERQDVATMRDAIDKYYGDLGHYPDALEDLVAKHYLRQIPVDPVTELADWVVVAPADTTLGNVFDVQPAPKANPNVALEH